MFDFFKNYFFFLIDKNRKEQYRDRVMKKDHFTYRVLLIVIMILQAIMIGVSFVTLNDTSAGIAWGYRGLYIFLFGICLTCFILLTKFFKANETFHYFLVVSLTMFSIMLWGCGVSLLDSVNHVDLTYLAVAMIACASFICLEPWVSVLSCFVSVIIFDILFTTLPFINPIAGFGFYIGTSTIVGAGIVGITFNFYRRINAIGLEIEVSELNTSLHGKAYMDVLTQVYNRRYLTEHIDDPLNYNTPGTGIMMIDLDHFKNVNDTYGHQVGDHCLSTLGVELNRLIKDQDAYAVRYGGEEFLLCFKEITPDKLHSLADRLKKTIEDTRVGITGGITISFTISIGLAVAKNGISYNNLINEADQALYRAKQTRNTVSF